LNRASPKHFCPWNASARDVEPERRVDPLPPRRTRMPRPASDRWFVHRTLAAVHDACGTPGRCHVPQPHASDGRAASHHWSSASRTSPPYRRDWRHTAPMPRLGRAGLVNRLTRPPTKGQTPPLARASREPPWSPSPPPASSIFRVNSVPTS
jgi:hypothetical protein